MVKTTKTKKTVKRDSKHVSSKTKKNTGTSKTKKLNPNKPIIIQIQGPSGSGKTTLGKRLSLLPNTVVIDTDDIDDPNSIKILEKYNYDNKKLEQFMDKELTKKNKKNIDKIISNNHDKIIIIVGFLHLGMQHIKPSKGYIIKIEPEILLKQYNLRTAAYIHQNYDEIKTLLTSDTNPEVLHFIFSKKFGIRNGFDCADIDDFKQDIERQEKRAKNNGYQYLSSDEIYENIKQFIIKL